MKYRHLSLLIVMISAFSVLSAYAQTTPSSPTPTITPTPAFEIGKELTIDYLTELEIEASPIVFEERLADGANYQQYIASYISEDHQIYGLLTIPYGDVPEGGFKAIVFNHGYIPPDIYRTTERYVAYVDALARAGFVVFKIDMRGHGNSEGEPRGAYFSPDYTIDALSAFKSLQLLDFVDSEGIGMWGHSMAGNLVLRAMLVEPEIKAGVIWAGAVYSYDDFVRYGITDVSFVPRDNQVILNQQASVRETYNWPDLTHPYWDAISLTGNIDRLQNPIQLHHAQDDDVVNIGYSFDLAQVLRENAKLYSIFSYEGGGHNISSPYFNTAMQRTIEFFRQNLSR
jgi:dipeptidyl aminopeptidase/acylaminoacyl peptidase